MATLQALAAEFRRDLLAQESRAAARMVRAYAVATARLSQQLDRVTRQIAQAEERGQPVGVSWLFQQERLANLKAQAEAALATFARQAAQETEARQAQTVAAAGEQARQLTLAALGDGPAPAVAAVEVSFLRLPAGALEELVGVLGDGSPLRRLFDALPALVSERLEQGLLAGVAAGLGPREIARQVREAESLGLNRALLIARTEVLRAHREATRATYQANADVVEGWVWTAELGPRTCPSCWALHGSFWPLDEPLASHPACRCSMSPRTRSWAELGFHGIPETRPEIEAGSDVFARQPEETQRAVLGPAGYEAYRRGEVSLADFVARRGNPEWGDMHYARSLRAVRDGRGGEVVGAAAVPGPPR
jgi:SPP1 gp7 family putative phage head morphogenesis protein